MSNVAVIRPSSLVIAEDAEFVQVNRLKKGKAVEKARHGIAHGANVAIVMAASSAGVRKTLVNEADTIERDRLAYNVANGIDYSEAWATVRGIANTTEIADVEGGKIVRAAWVELRKSLMKARPDANKTAQKAIDAALQVWADIQSRADELRAAK